MENWEYCHELGHGLIAYIFDGYFFNFESITFKKEDVEKANLNPQDIGYTVALPVPEMNDRIDENNYLAALVDGLYLLSGVAGASFLIPGNAKSEIEISIENYKRILNFNGSSGDFEIIGNARRPYGWYLQNTNVNSNQRIIVQCKLFEILRTLFNEDIIRSGCQILFAKLSVSNHLAKSNFADVFEKDYIDSLKEKLKLQLAFQSFGKIQG